ncbi:MAG: hypothetical protein AAF830_05355 [Pseudomonadota bacterium]
MILASLALVPFLLFSYRGTGVVMLAYWVAAMPLALVGWSWLTRAQPWLIALLALVVYGCFSVIWSPSSKAPEAFVYIILVLTGGPLVAHGRIRPELFMWCMFLAVAALLADAVTGNAIRGLVPPDNTPLKDASFTGRGVTLALLLLPAAVLAAYRTGGWRLGRGAIVLAGIAAASTPVALNGVMLLGGLGVMVMTALTPKIGLRMIVLAGGVVMAAPFALAAFLPDVETLQQISSIPDSFVHRLIIWRTVLDAWLAGGLLFGEGARATAELFAQGGTVTLASGAVLPLVSVHPHNAPTEVLYDLGLTGYSLLLAAYVFAARALLGRPIRRDMAAVLAATLWGAFVVLSLDYSIWSEFIPCTLVIAAWWLRVLSGQGGR